MAREFKVHWFIWLILLVLGASMFFYAGGRYDLGVVQRLLIACLWVLLLYEAHKHGLYVLSLVAFAGSTVFIALEISFDLGVWIAFAIAVLASIAVWFAYHLLKSKDKYPLLLFLLYLVVWVILGINAKYRHDWIMENILTVPFVALIYATHRRFKLSNLSYSLIFAFMTLHTVGSHYTYSEVPFGFWVQQFFGLSRNHYDRVIHFGFGFLLAYPVREIGFRLGNFAGFWGYYIPFELTLALSAIYEIIEWAVAVLFGGDLGIAYLGTQGDVWDAQKDMALAGVGALLAMVITAVVIVTLKPKEFFRQLHESLRVKHREVLGERALQAMMRGRRKF